MTPICCQYPPTVQAQLTRHGGDVAAFGQGPGMIWRAGGLMMKSLICVI